MNFLFILLIILYFGILVFGLVISLKHRFIWGFLFFVLISIKYLYHIISPHFQGRYIDNVLATNGNPPFGESVFEFAKLFTDIIPNTIQLIAFSCLVFGLYRLFKAKGSNKHLENQMQN